MLHDFAIAGHGWRRVLFRLDGSAHDCLTVPAGGTLVAEILRQASFTVASATPSGGLLATTGPIALDAAAPTKVTVPVALPSPEHRRAEVAGSGVPGPVRTEHAALVEQGGNYGIGERYGWTAGADTIGPVQGQILVVWDEGFGPIQVDAKAEHILWVSARQLPPRHIIEQIAAKTVLVLEADVLRDAGALISRQISWERTATELVWQLTNNPTFAYLRAVPAVVVVLAEDGAVTLERDGDSWRARLTLTTGAFEGATRQEAGLTVPDAWAGFVAAIAADWKVALATDPAAPWLDDAVAVALWWAAGLARRGYDLTALKCGNFLAWIDGAEPAPEPAAEPHGYEVPISTAPDNADPDFWCISSASPGANVAERAHDYVMEGASAIEGIPRFTCGALTTIDRREIEAFQTIRNLIVSYAESTAPMPLSIAVFGAPGSGKSFGVTQIAENVLPGLVHKLEFNVSQMSSLEDLATAFHEVRDWILRGKLPLVFFDEFDSDRDGRRLGWLKYFLMPMQDGAFRDAHGSHPVGRCILVFAGGTSPSLAQFTAPLSPLAAGADDDAVEQAEAAAADFRAVKGPDFVSRLKGTIDVLGPNPAWDGDINFPLRRALLLRSLLERQGTPAAPLPISEDVLDALLKVPAFAHGSRSLEAVLDMSRIAGARWDPASLPFQDQLALHVDAKAFMGLVLQGVTFNAHIEMLARAIHAQYLDRQAKRRGPDAQPGPAEVPWSELGEDLREANRDHARAIPKKLRSIGYDFDDAGAERAWIEQLAPAEIEQLSREEHVRWMDQRKRAGWVYGPVLDDTARRHPDIVPWEELSQADQQKDRDTVENIVRLLAEAGLGVYRTGRVDPGGPASSRSGQRPGKRPLRMI